ncbi:MAG: hypothetical protein ACTSQJ_10155 [Promethearchaeota archaeon]
MNSCTKTIYQTLLNSGLNKGELDSKIEKKAKEFKGFISKKGILFIIAKELGIKVRAPEINSEIYNELEEQIDYDEFTIKISEISKDMTNIVLLGRIKKKFGFKNFYRKDGTPGLVGTFIIYDNSGEIKIVLWNEHVKIMENEFFQINELIRIIGGYSKLGFKNQLEVHIGKKGKIFLAPKDANPNNIPQKIEIEDSNNLKDNFQKKGNINIEIQDLHDIEGFVKKIEGIVSKIEQFKEINLKSGEKSFLLKFIISDDKSAIRVVVWGIPAVNCLRVINEGDLIALSNVLIKFNSYTGEKEINFTKYSKLIKL